jgi:hypothetical protein
MMLNNKDELTITGVVADAPGNTSFKYNMLIPYAFFKLNNTYSANNWSGNYQGSTFVILGKEQSPDVFRTTTCRLEKEIPETGR